MQQGELIIPPTENTPEVILRSDSIVIRGRSLKIIERQSFKMIEAWVDRYIVDPPEKTTVNIYLEYLNKGNILYYLNILRKFITIRMKGRELIINWYHDNEDEDIIEKGEYLSSLLGIQFNFIQMPD